MAASIVNCCRSKVFQTIQCFPRSTQYICRRNEHSMIADEVLEDEVQYPPVKPKYPPGSEWGSFPSKIAWQWEEERVEISKLRSVPEKLDYLTRGIYRTWKFPVIQYSPNLLRYQADKTKTALLYESEDPHGIQSLRLPDIYSSVNIEEEKDVLKSLLIESIELEHEMNRHIHEERFTKRNKYITLTALKSFDNELSHLKIKNLLTTLLGSLSGKYRHIADSHLDEDVKVSASWNRDRVQRKGPKHDHPNFYQHNNAPFQAEHDVNFQIRKEKPLPQFLPRDHLSCIELSYDMMSYHPKVLGQFSEPMQRSFSPGFNLGDPYEFSHLNVVLTNDRMLNHVNKKFGEACMKEALNGYLLSTGFISTVAQAHYQGFNLHEELTYPFTTQTIATDGREFMFSAYQLNTLQLWKEDTACEYQNVCWINRPRPLYDQIENGKLVGFNDDTFHTLLKFLLIRPDPMDGVDIRPNLDAESSPLNVSTYIPDKRELVEVEEAITYDKN